MSVYPPIDRIAELQQMIADFSKVTRVVDIADTGRLENDVEHSYGLAMTAWFLHDKIAPHLDIGKVLKYALAHDVVEIHAGDTFIFDAAAVATKEIRERDAISHLADDWSDFPELSSYAEGYADKIDEEARFVYAIDKLLPVIMVELSDPKQFWEQKKITLEMERHNKVTILRSEIVAPYYEKLIAWLDDRGNIPKS